MTRKLPLDTTFVGAGEYSNEPVISGIIKYKFLTLMAVNSMLRYSQRRFDSLHISPRNEIRVYLYYERA